MYRYGLEHTRNLYFPSLSGPAEDRVAGWLVQPGGTTLARTKQAGETCSAGPGQECGLEHQDTVFILLHGNAKNRGASHRIAAYKIFQVNLMVSLLFVLCTLELN